MKIFICYFRVMINMLTCPYNIFAMFNPDKMELTLDKTEFLFGDSDCLSSACASNKKEQKIPVVDFKSHMDNHWKLKGLVSFRFVCPSPRITRMSTVL